MTVKRIAIIVFLFVLQAWGVDLHADNTTGRPLLLIFDASGSMKEKQGGERKMDTAKRIVSEFLQGFPGNTTLGVIVYGHRRAKDCSALGLMGSEQI